MDRREFLARASALVIGGLAMAQALFPRYVEAQTISFTDARIKAKYVEYPSPGRQLRRDARLSRAAGGTGPFPAVLVIHENRGLNPYVEDVARRAAVAGFVALGARRLVAGRRLSRQRRRRPHAAVGPRSGEAAPGHGQQRALPEIARAVDGQARRHGFLLGRRHGQQLGRRDRRRLARRRAVLRRGARGGRRAEDQDAAADPARRDATSASTRCIPSTRPR